MYRLLVRRMLLSSVIEVGGGSSTFDPVWLRHVTSADLGYKVTAAV